MGAQGVQPVNESLVKAYAEDMRGLLEEADITERKAFLRSFVTRVEIDKEQVTVHYTLPMPPDGKSSEQAGVLPIGTLGGPWCSIHRTKTFELAFGLCLG
jgi:hypothetical protein